MCGATPDMVEATLTAWEWNESPVFHFYMIKSTENNYFTLDELKAAVDDWTDDDLDCEEWMVERTFAEMDTSGDGKVSAEEYIVGFPCTYCSDVWNIYNTLGWTLPFDRVDVPERTGICPTTEAEYL